MSHARTWQSPLGSAGARRSQDKGRKYDSSPSQFPTSALTMTKTTVIVSAYEIAGRNINNLRYAHDTTLMAESEEELKSFLTKVKVESEKVGLKLNIQKMKIMASGPITSWEIDGETVETDSDFIFLWQPTPVFLPGESHGRRSLVGYSPWGCKESDMTEPLHFHFH